MLIRLHHVGAVLVLVAFGVWLRVASKERVEENAAARARALEPAARAVITPEPPGIRDAAGSDRAGQRARGAVPPGPSTESARPAWDTEIVGTSGGSAVPCAVPLAIRLARIDQAFGIDTTEAIAAIRRAAALWESAVGRLLFRLDPDSGFPIRFVYDDRQAAVQERNRVQAAYEAESQRLREWRADLEKRDAIQVQLQEGYARRWRAFQARLDEHNQLVDRINREGGAPPDVARQIWERVREFEAEQEALQREARELQEARERIQEEMDQFNRAAAAHRERGLEIERRFPMVRVESGRYREVLRMRDDAIVDISREIQIYRYSDGNELVLLIAHELGHALGLAHASEPSAVMSEEHLRTDPTVTPALHRADVELFRSKCPSLFSD